jgi:hypothetical protein
MCAQTNPAPSQTQTQTRTQTQTQTQTHTRTHPDGHTDRQADTHKQLTTVQAAMSEHKLVYKITYFSPYFSHTTYKNFRHFFGQNFFVENGFTSRTRWGERSAKRGEGGGWQKGERGWWVVKDLHADRRQQ